MSTEPINYDAVLADLEAKKAQIEAAIAGLRALVGTVSASAPGPTVSTQRDAAQLGKVTGANEVPTGAFLGKSIPEATKAYLAMIRKPQSTNEVIAALQQGGVRIRKYQTAWSILYRREVEVADICRVDGDWALADWYPNIKRTPKPRTRKGKTGKKSATPSQPQAETQSAGA